jgi:methylated-DNA-[protein]-cysteine S-methyltransferase
MQKTAIDSPLGTIVICANDRAITAVSFDDASATEATDTSPILEMAAKQLSEYFANERTGFHLPLEPEGSKFQRSVWNTLLDIPFGKTESYLGVSKIIGDEKALRAVGLANGKNPIAIIIPCHRVIGSDGSLTGYAGGLWRKEWLLRHEGVLNQTTLF